MTAPTFQTLTWIVTGWAFAPRRTVTGIMLAAGVVGKKHHSAFHRLVSAAQWSLDPVSLAVFEQLAVWILRQSRQDVLATIGTVADQVKTLTCFRPAEKRQHLKMPVRDGR